MLDTCIENGVEPMVCLEHYELPTYLLDKYNGWSSRHVVDLFVKYALKAFERFGDRVKILVLLLMSRLLFRPEAIWMQ